MINTVWELPDEGLEPTHLANMVHEAIGEVEGAELRMGAAMEGRAGLTFRVGLPEWLVRKAGDRPARPPDESGHYWCVVRVEAGGDGRRAMLALEPAAADGRLVPGGASEIVERIAVLLGGQQVQ